MGEEKAQSYYNLCKQSDVIGLIRPLLQQAGYRLRDADGKIYAETFMAWDTPWHHVYHAGNLDCHTWHKIMFDFVFKATDKKFVPINCQNCFKVVCRPPTLKSLFTLLDLQKRLGLPSKCGIEIRMETMGLYGGYWYCWGIDQGLDRYEIVREAIDKEPGLGPDVPVVLKRACTEFEMVAGPSDKWEVTEEQEHLEALVNRWLVRDIKHRTQPDHAIATVHRKWIEWAYMAGDLTFLEYTNGVPVHPATVTFHHMAEERKQEKDTGEK